MKYICLAILWVPFASTVLNRMCDAFNANGHQSVPKDSLAATAALEQARTKSKLRDIFVEPPGFQSPPGCSTLCNPMYIYMIYIYIYI